MWWEIINIVTICALYYYFIRLYQIDCKCALTPNYYFLVAYVSIALILFFIGLFKQNNSAKNAIGNASTALNIYIGIVFAYFIISIIFIFITFRYVNELERKHCTCAGEVGPIFLQILAWVRVLTLGLALVVVIFTMSSLQLLK